MEIIKPVSENSINFSGDKQYGVVNEILEYPIRVKIVSNNNPVANIKIEFSFGDLPENVRGQKILTPVAFTDSNGIAETKIILGSEPGEYEIIAKQTDNNHDNFLIYNVYARKSNWVIMLIIGLLGGLSIFLFGMNLMGAGLQNVAGDRMRSILAKLTKNRIIGVLLGIFATVMMQSSSASTSMLVGFVESRLLKFKQTISVILGAAIGTTITAQLIAFNLADYSLLIVFTGFILFFIKKSEQTKHLGQIILGFGLIFFGMEIMSDTMSPLRTYTPFINIMLTLNNPVYGVIAGVVFTALIQSSGAFIGILIVLASQGFLTLETSIPLVLGSNIGTSITAFLASIGTGRDAKKVAIAQFFIKVTGVLIFIWLIPELIKITNIVTDPFYKIDSSQIIPRKIANAHTLFNIFLTIIFLPFTNLIAKLFNWILPTKEDENAKLKYLNNSSLQNPALALSFAKQEMIRMARIVQDMLNDIILPFFTKESNLINEIRKKEELVDFIHDEVKIYVIRITQEDIPKSSVNEAFQMLYVLKEFEHIADIISTNLLDKAVHWIKKNNEFSEPGKKEIMEYHLKAQKQLSRAIEVFRDINLERANIMREKQKKYRQLANELERLHYERLKDDVNLSISTSEEHLHIIVALREITNHATNIARIMTDWSKSEDYMSPPAS
ncbi:MAG: Na/Pi cotransporter family protein [Marinilabiliales bacterium]